MDGGCEKVRLPWNKGKLVGQKLPLKARENWEIRRRLQLEHRLRDLALFNLGIDSKLRGCDLVALRVREQTRDSVGVWIGKAALRPDDFLFPSRIAVSPPEAEFAGHAWPSLNRMPVPEIR